MILGASCSRSNAPCDLLCNAQRLDERSVGEGKISLVDRQADIRNLISAYEAALPGCSESQVNEVKSRLDALELELQLVEAIFKSLRTMNEELEEIAELPFSITLTLAGIGAVYEEAGFLEGMAGTPPDLAARLYDNSIPPDPDMVSQEPSEKHLVWILTAINAHPSGVPEWFKADIIESDYMTGYNLTHQFITLLAQELVWDDYDFGQERVAILDKLAKRIADAEDADCLSDVSCRVDLYAERIHFLIIGGYGELVKPEWLQHLLEMRLEDGLWPYFSIEDAHSWHTSHMAIAALAGYQVYLQRGERGRSEMFSLSGVDF